MLRAALLAIGALLAVDSWQLAEARRTPPPVSANRQLPTANSIIIPVQGIQPAQLKPTFNQARAGHVHHALDILAPRGTPVVAAVDGTIRKLFVSAAGGITIYEFDRDASLVYYYAHLDRYADNVREGMRVRQGDVIGYVGTTGNAPASTPHLHFAIGRLTAEKKWWQSEAIDPYPILTRPASAPPTLASGPD
jgi:murein DD-endopeptidase MepM/ murein hydrolase activator NlpD